MVVFLVGFMGCGKSTVGRSVAKKLGYDFVDMDRDIESRAGMTVAEMFERHGEAFFRDREREALERYAGRERLVVATGGGAPCAGDNMERMRRQGLTVYLKMSPEKLVGRLTPYGREKRPLLRGKNDDQVLAFIRERLPQREPYYDRAAMVIDCDGAGDAYISDHLVDFIVKQQEVTDLR